MRISEKKVFLIVLCLCLLFVSVCMRLGNSGIDTCPPERRVFYGVQSMGKVAKDNFLFPSYITIPIAIGLFPFALIGDIVFLPYDLFLAASVTSWSKPEAGPTVKYPGTPEGTALKNDDSKALAALWASGLKMSQLSVDYICSKLEKPVRGHIDDYLEYVHFCNLAVKKIAEDDAWNYLPDEQNFLSNYIFSTFEALTKSRLLPHSKKEPEIQEIQQDILNSLETMLNHGIAPSNAIKVKTFWLIHVPRRLTLLDWVYFSAGVPSEVRLQVLRLLKEHGALPYAELVRQDPGMSSLHLDGVRIAPVFQPIIDLLEGSPKADCYRFSDSYPGLSGDVLVVEEGYRDSEGQLHYTYEVPVVEREHPETTFMLELPIHRRIFYSIASEKGYNKRQQVDVYYASEHRQAPEWLADKYIFQDQNIREDIREKFSSFPQCELYQQYYMHIMYSKYSPRVKLKDDYLYESDWKLVSEVLTNPYFTGKEKKWGCMAVEPKKRP